MKAAPATGFLLPVEGNPFRQVGHASEAMAAIGTTPLQDRVWVVTGAKIDCDDLQGERSYKGYKAYGQSKLAQILFTVEYGRRLAGTGVTVNAVHPGVIKTNLAFGESPKAFRFVRMFFKSPAKGAETPIFLVASPTVANLTGQYFVNRQVQAPSHEAQDPAVARRLYDVSVKLAGLGTDEGRGTPP